MSVHNRAIVRLLIRCALVFGVAVLGKPSKAGAFTCHSECANAWRSCYLACGSDPDCQAACDADYQACLACCDTGC